MRKFITDMAATVTAISTVAFVGVFFGIGFGVGFVHVVKDKIIAVVPVSEVKK